MTLLRRGCNFTCPINYLQKYFSLLPQLYWVRPNQAEKGIEIVGLALLIDVHSNQFTTEGECARAGLCPIGTQRQRKGRGLWKLPAAGLADLRRSEDGGVRGARGAGLRARERAGPWRSSASGGLGGKRKTMGQTKEIGHHSSLPYEQNGVVIYTKAKVLSSSSQEEHFPQPLGALYFLHQKENRILNSGLGNQARCPSPVPDPS
ncbi:uncharacterized protein LOC104846731 isoform X2 [Loxodonta africana]|uniref:uncharacterized protein LOC104846731 isoform X2 n=1 Tax=Loxodonta africana TaxID=9785 RepID=UPI0030D173DB